MTDLKREWQHGAARELSRDLAGPRTLVVRDRDLPIVAPAPQAPECPGCGTRLKPIYVANPERTGRVWRGFTGYVHFCTQRCATAYANLTFEETGVRYRIK